MTTAGRILLFAGLTVLPLQSAGAANIAAIVEAVSGPAGDLTEMDLLEQGRTIELGQGATLTLGYPQSCLRETIQGGHVTIGAENSKVAGGKVSAETVPCAAGQVIASGRSADVAGAVFRKGAFEGASKPNPDILLHGTGPLIRFAEPIRTLRIERLDAQEKVREIPVGADRVDLGERNIALQPGGYYAISAGSAPLVVQIAPDAKGDAPLLSRLIVM